MVASCPKCLSSTSNQKGQKARRHCMIPQPNAGSGCTTGKLGNTVSHCRNSGKCVRLLGRVLKQVPRITPCPASSRPTPGETIRRVNGPQMKPSNRIRIIVFFTALLFLRDHRVRSARIRPIGPCRRRITNAHLSRSGSGRAILDS